MDDRGIAELLAAVIAASAANKAVIRLCKLLHRQGLVGYEEVEAFRQLHLRSFDAAISATGDEAGRAAIEDHRAEYDGLWHSLFQDEWPS